MASSITEKDEVKAPDTTLGSEVPGEANGDPLNRVFSKTSPVPHSTETSFTPINKAATKENNTGVPSASATDRDVDKAADASENSMADGGDAKDMDSSDVVKESAGKSTGKSTGKSVGKDEIVEKTKTTVKEPAEKAKSKKDRLLVIQLQ